MNRYDARLIPAVVLLATLTAAVFLGCTETPTEAAYTNPLDPAGAFGGDPFDVQAYRDGNKIFVTWTSLDLGDLAGYRVERKTGPEGLFTLLVDLDPEFTSYADSSFAPNQLVAYRVLALDAEGNTSATSSITPATIVSAAVVDLGGFTSTSSRQYEILVRAAVGDRVEVDDDEGFASPESYPLDEEGQAVFLWDLGPADGNGEMKYIYTRVFTGEAASAARIDSLEVDFSPALFFAGNRPTLASRTTPLQISGGGLTRMRFAVDRAGLATAPWLDPADTYGDWLLAAEADSQLVFGEFDGEFGFTFTDSAWAAPDSLAGLVLLLNGGSETLIGPAVPVFINAVATQIRAAAVESDLAVTPWEPYDGILDFVHDACASDLQKTVYAQVRNDWFTSQPLGGTVVWQPDEVLGVTFAGPDTVTVDAEVTLSGEGVRGTCSDPIDLVELDSGDGWVAAAGTADWSLAWTAPSTAGTDTLRARVTAGDEVSVVQTFVIVVMP